MIRKSSQVVGAVALIILRLAAPCPALPQSAASDAERAEVARALMEAERERQERAFEHVTQLSTENIESLNPAEFATGFELTLLTPKEIEERAKGFIGAHYLAFEEFNIEGARAVVKLAVTRELTPCFGPYQKHQKEFAYRLERVNEAWKAKDVSPPFGVKPNNGMHPTADTLPLIFGSRPGRRVMPGVRLLPEEKVMNEKAIELTISMINEEMNRFWTRFNIFGAVQVGAVIGIASAAQFLFGNLTILRSVFILLIAFSISGAVAIFRGHDLQRSLVLTLAELEQLIPEDQRLLDIARRHQRLPLYLSSITCSIFGILCVLFWVIGWIILELTKYNINLSK